jgi:hypothetical protein
MNKLLRPVELVQLVDRGNPWKPRPVFKGEEVKNVKITTSAPIYPALQVTKPA